MQTKHQAILTGVAEQLQITEAFLLRYSDKLPKDVGSPCVHPEHSNFLILTEYLGNDVREQILTLVGEIFGRTGWEAELAYGGRHFDWKKIIDGVNVTIYAAQKVDAPEKFPVDPKQFPLQITDITV